jgi:hypothetical protein
MSNPLFVKKRKSILKKILISAAIIVALVLFLELMVRLLFPQNLNYTMFDKNLMFKQVPNLEFRYFWIEFDNQIKFNSKGLRDFEYLYEKDGNTYRILMLGSSLLEGLQVEMNETFPKILEKRLNDRRNSNTKYEVINTGVGGYGTENELLYFEIEGLKYNPDMVILTVPLRDIDTNLLSPLTNVENGTLKKNTPVSQNFLKGTMLYCSRYMHLCAWTHNVLLQNLKDNELSRNLFEILGISSKGDDKKVNTRTGSEVYLKNNSDLFNEGLSEMFLTILETEKIADQNDINFVLMTLPDQEQVDNKSYQEFLQKNNLTEKETERFKFQRIVREFAVANNITLIDPIDSLRKKNLNNDVYLKVGAHFNKFGHEAIADYLYTELNKMPRAKS